MMLGQLNIGLSSTLTNLFNVVILWDDRLPRRTMGRGSCRDNLEIGWEKPVQDAVIWDGSGLIASITPRARREESNLMFCCLFSFTTPAYHPERQG